MDTKKKMSNRDKMMLFIFGAILIVAAAYFLVFAKMNEKRSALEAENTTLSQEVSKLETMEAQKDSVLEETKQTQLDVADVLSKFPADVKIESESFNMNQLFYQQGAVDTDTTTGATANASPAPKSNPASVAAITSDTPVNDVITAAADYTGYRSTVNVSFTSTYDSLKKVVDFINKSKDRMTISEISATADDEESVLACAMTIDMYAISGTGEVYESPNVSNGNTGVDNIFRK